MIELVYGNYIFLIIAYFIGTVPFGLVLTKLAGLGDIRNIGSGNIGATNVLRTGSKKIALATLILDGLKGILAIVLVAQFRGEYDLLLLVGLCAVLGHIFPIWLKFKGGKGVATTLAVFLFFNITGGVLTCVMWLTTFYLTRISSLSAIMAMIVMPIYLWFIASENEFLIAITLSLIVIMRHYQNIGRLIKGEEKKF